MYDEASGIAQNYTEAVHWYRVSAEQGHAEARSNLGLMYEDGKGVAQDFKLAHMWLSIGAANGSDFVHEDINRIAQQMTAEAITEAQQGTGLHGVWLSGLQLSPMEYLIDRTERTVVKGCTRKGVHQNS